MNLELLCVSRACNFFGGCRWARCWHPRLYDNVISCRLHTDINVKENNVYRIKTHDILCAPPEYLVVDIQSASYYRQGLAFAMKQGAMLSESRRIMACL